MAGRSAWIGGLIAACITAGCAHDECDLGDDHCAGRVRMTCEAGSCHTPDCFPGPGRAWRSEPCENACVEQPSTPLFCAASDQPDPHCDKHVEGTGADPGYCDGAVAVSCWLGFATFRTDCAESGKSCVATDWGGRICALSQQMDARCRKLALSGGGRDFCDGMQLLSCDAGYLVSARTCRNACVSPEAGWAFCAASSEPDPGCDSDVRPSRPRFECPAGSGAICAGKYAECTGDDAYSDASANDAGASDASVSDAAVRDASAH